MVCSEDVVVIRGAGVVAAFRREGGSASEGGRYNENARGIWRASSRALIWVIRVRMSCSDVARLSVSVDEERPRRRRRRVRCDRPSEEVEDEDEELPDDDVSELPPVPLRAHRAMECSRTAARVPRRPPPKKELEEDDEDDEEDDELELFALLAGEGGRDPR